MGAGGSVPDETTAAIAAEAGKPADASDCATTEAAVEEVKRLRALLAQHKSATTGAAASPAKTAAEYDPDRFKGLSLDADAEIGTPAHPKLASTKSRRFLTRMASGDVSGAVAEITSKTWQPINGRLSQLRSQITNCPATRLSGLRHASCFRSLLLSAGHRGLCGVEFVMGACL